MDELKFGKISDEEIAANDEKILSELAAAGIYWVRHERVCNQMTHYHGEVTGFNTTSFRFYRSAKCWEVKGGEHLSDRVPLNVAVEIFEGRPEGDVRIHADGNPRPDELEKKMNPEVLALMKPFIDGGTEEEINEFLEDVSDRVAGKFKYAREIGGKWYITRYYVDSLDGLIFLMAKLRQAKVIDPVGGKNTLYVVTKSGHKVPFL